MIEMKDRFKKIYEISLRADNILDKYENRSAYPSRVTIMMDVENADRQFNLRLDELLEAEDYEGAHEVFGIVNNIDRTTGKVGNFFVPRFAGRSEKHGELSASETA